MTRQLRTSLVLLLALLTATTGCQPIQPFYFHEDGDLSHFLDTATDMEHPDVFAPSLTEVEYAQRPLSYNNAQFEFWDLSLEQVVAITLTNSKVIRNLGGVTPFGFADALIGRVATATTVFDAAIVESDPQNGVEAALAAFDAQLSVLGSQGNNNFLSQTDRPSTFTPDSVIVRDLGGLRTELAKRSAYGTQFFVRNQTDYTRGDNLLGGPNPVNSLWETLFEIEVRQPLLRGRGTQVNRVPLLLARINTDVTLATFEASVRNLILDVENTYWNLYFAYRDMQAARSGLDAAQVTWNNLNVRLDVGTIGVQEEAQAREQYYFFRAALETAQQRLFDQESQLRFLMGLTSSDGRLIRPSDEPTTARVTFDWSSILAEAVVRTAELRQQRWAIKRRELELVAAKNQLLPQLDVGATYRWYGIGDKLISSDRNGINFVDPPGPIGSRAFDVLTEGRYQEAAFLFNFQAPIGYRREMAGVRNAQLNLVRDKARLEDMELNTVHLLSTAWRSMETNYQVAQTQLNRWKAATEEVESAEILYETGKTAIDLVLDAQRRQATAQSDYYRALSEYNKSVVEVHFRKGSLLEHNNVALAEGPWPEKAYWDALGRARQRDASYYMNYGWTRPSVISQGPTFQPADGSVLGGELPHEPLPATEPAPLEDGQVPESGPALREPGPIAEQPWGPELNTPRRATLPDRFEWGDLQLQ